MEVKEFKIGNYVNLKRGATIIDSFRVDEIRREDGLYMIRMYLDRLGRDSWIDALPEHAQPIPLTKEILLKCGFTCEDYSVKMGYRKKIYRNSHITELLFIDYSSPVNENNFVLHNYATHPVSSLHRLQNLYFELTGKELEVDL